jgi:hydroxypyruvate isomerase
MERFAVAKAAGFVAVEYQFPYAFDKSELAQALRRHSRNTCHVLPTSNSPTTRVATSPAPAKSTMLSVPAP